MLLYNIHVIEFKRCMYMCIWMLSFFIFDHFYALWVYISTVYVGSDVKASSL